MAEHVSDGDPHFAVLRELGPDTGDGGVGIEQAPLDHGIGAQGRDALRRRIHEHDRVLAPWRLRRRVGDSAPEVDDRPAIDIHAQRRADLAPLVEVLGERVKDGFELARHRAVDRHGPYATPVGENDLEPVELEPIDVDEDECGPPVPRAPLRIRPAWILAGIALLAAWITIAVATRDDQRRVATPAITPTTAATAVPPTTPATTAQKSAVRLILPLQFVGGGRFAAVIDNQLFVLDGHGGTARRVNLPAGLIEIQGHSGGSLLVRTNNSYVIVETAADLVEHLPADSTVVPADDGSWAIVHDDLLQDGLHAKHIPSGLRILAGVDGGYLADDLHDYVVWSDAGINPVAGRQLLLAIAPRMIALRGECPSFRCAVDVLNLEARTTRHTQLSTVPTGAEFSPSDSKLAVVSTLGEVTVIDWLTGREVLQTTSRESPDTALPFSWTPDGDALLVVQDGGIDVYRADTGALTRAIYGGLPGLQQIVALP